jgi:hypothetical protein
MADSRKHQHADGWSSDEIFRSMRRNAEAYKKKDMELIKVKEELEILKKDTKELIKIKIKKALNHSNNIMNSVSSDLREFIKPFNCEVLVCAEKGDFDGVGEYDLTALISINEDNEINFKFNNDWEGTICLNKYDTGELGFVDGYLCLDIRKSLDINSSFGYNIYRMSFKENNLLILYLQLKGYNWFTHDYW